MINQGKDLTAHIVAAVRSMDSEQRKEWVAFMRRLIMKNGEEKRMTLFEQYEKAEQEWHEKRNLALQQDVDCELFDELSEQIEAEGLKLVLDNVTGCYYVATVAGVQISDDLMTLEDVQNWLDDPEFRFLINDEEDQGEMTAAEIEKLCRRLEKMPLENRRELVDLLNRLITLMD